MSEETPELSKEASGEVRRVLRSDRLTIKGLERLSRLCQDVLPDDALVRLVRLRTMPSVERGNAARQILGPYLAPEDDPHAREMFELAMSLGEDPKGDQ